MIASSYRLASCAAINQLFHQALTQYYALPLISNSVKQSLRIVCFFSLRNTLCYFRPPMFIYRDSTGLPRGLLRDQELLIDEITHLQPFNSSRPSRASLFIRFFALLLDSLLSGDESSIISHWLLLALYRESHLLRSVLTIVIFETVRDTAK